MQHLRLSWKIKTLPTPQLRACYYSLPQQIQQHIKYCCYHCCRFYTASKLKSLACYHRPNVRFVPKMEHRIWFISTVCAGWTAGFVHVLAWPQSTLIKQTVHDSFPALAFVPKFYSSSKVQQFRGFLEITIHLPVFSYNCCNFHTDYSLLHPHTSTFMDVIRMFSTPSICLF